MHNVSRHEAPDQEPGTRRSGGPDSIPLWIRAVFLATGWMEDWGWCVLNASIPWFVVLAIFGATDWRSLAPLLGAEVWHRLSLRGPCGESGAEVVAKQLAEGGRPGRPKGAVAPKTAISASTTGPDKTA